MAKFHINKNGVPAPCRAEKGNCPFGDDDSHYDTIEEAQEAADKVNEKEHGLLADTENAPSEKHEEFLDEIERKDRNQKGEYVGIKKVEDEMIYHDAEAVEGVYNKIQSLRDKNGSIKGTYGKLVKELSSLNKKHNEIRKNIEDDLKENDEFGKRYRQKDQEVKDLEKSIEEDQKKAEANNSGTCPKCGEGTLVERDGRYGKFISCSRFPKCKHTSKKAEPSKRLQDKLNATKDQRQIELQKIQAQAKEIQKDDAESKKLEAKISEVGKDYSLVEYAHKHENPEKRPGYPQPKGSLTPIENYYNDRKAADDKILKEVGKTKIAINSGKMSYGPNEINETLTTDSNGNINNLYLEHENNKGELKRVVKIHESGEGNLEFEDGERMTMAHSYNWRMNRDVSPPQSWKLHTTEPNGDEYKEYDKVIMLQHDSGD